MESLGSPEEQQMNLFMQNVRDKALSSVETTVQGNTEFAFDLYQRLRKADGNLFFSPYSISTALAMTYAGARSDTEVQIAQALHFLLDQGQLHPSFASLEAKMGNTGRKGHIKLRVANTLWPQKGYAFLEGFLALTKQNYGVLITPVDYGNEEATRHTINSWVEEKTEGKIKDLIPPGMLNDLTRLILVNAIYFKGNWASQFNRNLTRNAPFWVTPDEQVQVPMMTQKHEFRYGESDGLQVLELPYIGDDLSMIVLLPTETDGLAKLEESMTVENLYQWTKDLWEKEVEVFLPRFEITFPFRLDDALKSMGMVNAFSDEADFSGMDGSKELYIAAVLHKAFVTVNEEGTEAAAATAVIIKSKGPPSSPPVFRADHPFVFLIRENSTGSILFLGRVVNPAYRVD
jgi:serine protease inhibitor